MSRSKILVLALAVASFAIPGGAGAAGVFQLIPAFSASDPVDTVLADHDGDGLLDLLVALRSPSQMLFRRGNGNGTFGSAQAIGVGGTGRPVALASQDFDGDGDADVVAAHDAGWIVHHRGSSPVFAFGTTNRFIGGAPSDVAIADLDGDGLLDVVVADPTRPLVSVLYGDPTQVLELAPTTYPLTASGRVIAIGDLNGDGLPDIVTGGADGTLRSLTNAGGRTLLPEIGSAAGANVFGLVLADANGDGALDAIYSEPSVDRLAVAPGTGTGAFGPRALITGTDGPIGLAVADMNGDGRSDLLVAQREAFAVGLLLGEASSFGAPTHVPSGGNRPLAVAPGDLNGDGALDLVVANNGSNEVNALLSRGQLELPSSVAVGDVTSNESASTSITISNTGFAPLTIQTPSVSGGDASAFTIAGTCAGSTLGYGATCSIDLTFGPARLGAHVATLSVPHDGTGPNSIALSGTGTDGIAPQTVINRPENGILLSPLSSLSGRTIDRGTGVDVVRVRVTPVVGDATESDAILTCDARRLVCDWLLQAPMIPGPYLFEAWGIDLNGNVESPPVSAEIIVV